MMKAFSLFFFSVAALVNMYFVRETASRGKAGTSRAVMYARNISKALIVPGLMLVYVFFTPSVDPLLISALLCGFLGDVCLMVPGGKGIDDPPRGFLGVIIDVLKRMTAVRPVSVGKVGKKPALMFLVAGMVFFAAGHVLYTVVFLRVSFRGPGILPLYLSYLPYLFYGMILFPIIGYEVKYRLVKICIPVYLVFLTAMSWAALTAAIHAPGTGSAMMFIGSLFFVASDTVLAMKYFGGMARLPERLVMGTYITAQLLIVSGFIFFP